MIVRLRACGVCGSDRHLVHTDADGYMVDPGCTRLPVIVGHEFVISDRVPLERVATALRAEGGLSSGKVLASPHAGDEVT